MAGRLAGWLALGVALLGCDGASARSKSSAKGEGSSPVSSVRVESAKVDFELPDFELVDHENRPFKKADLASKVWVVDFIFTTCPSICPAMTKKMSGLAKDLGGKPNVGFLSITVDAENDTPEKLRSFAEQNGGLSPSWRLLTGEPQKVDALITKGFLSGIRRGTEKLDIAHSERFVLVDTHAHVRGLYSIDEAGLAELKKAIDGELSSR